MYNQTMEELPEMEQEEEHDYEHDPRYVRNLKKWNEAQLTLMFSDENKEKVAKSLGKNVEDLEELEIATEWAKNESPRFREENINNPEFYHLREAA